MLSHKPARNLVGLDGDISPRKEMMINMNVYVYDGNSSSLLTSYGGVTTATINKDGSVSVTRDITSPDGQAIFSIKPNGNKIEIVRAYNE